MGFRDNNIKNHVAIIGMVGRFPAATNIDELWENLYAGAESITFFADDELDLSIDSTQRQKPNYVRARGVLKGAEEFDARFFGMSPRQAQLMDPQQRVFLEASWEALENAGYDPDDFDGSIGVYAGMGNAGQSYYINNVLSNPDIVDSIGEFQTFLLNEKDYLATRVSYKLNLTGPSLNINTACSTSLVAVCQAFYALNSSQCDMALAGGICITCPQNSGYLHERGNILSIDGHCRPFDAQAEGTVFGNGVGIVVLKRLTDALKDGDHIYAVIRSVGLNNDGSDKMSYTAPSAEGQAKAIKMALSNAKVDPETITYVEAHGTGTLLGDPIEIAGLTKAFRSHTSAKGFCAVGSIKSNIGHLDTAAGIASLIKTVLALKHQMLPPSINFSEPNPKIDFSNSPFYVNDQLKKWQTNDLPRRAGVSSFGVGGTNAHVILEEAPESTISEKSRPYQLLLISAKSARALEIATENLFTHLNRYGHDNFADVAYTLQVGRKEFSQRRFVVCRDHDDAIAKLESLLASVLGEVSIPEPAGREVVFMFSGQGSQYVNMGLELYKTEVIFKKEIDKCAKILEPQLSFDLKSLLYPEDKNTEESAEKLKQTFITQPALFAFEYSLAKLWMSWGIDPVTFVGHSIGEYVAACLSGVFSLEDALKLVSVRGRLIQELPGGSMLAVPLSEETIKPFLNENLSLAAINSPNTCVIAGKGEAISNLRKELSDKNITVRNLHTSHAFHSTMMDSILDRFSQEVEKITPKIPQIPFVSNVSGTWISSEEATTPEYWVRHLRQTVRFSDCIKTLLKGSSRVFIEVGPGNTLSSLAKQHSNKVKERHLILSSTRHPHDNDSDVAFILKSLGQLWAAGVDVNWTGFYGDEKRCRVPVPTYPFERKRHWVEPSRSATEARSLFDDAVNPTQTLDDEAKKKKRSSTEGINKSLTLRTSAEELVAAIWREVLGVEEIGVKDNFVNLGGDSLSAVMVVEIIKKKTGVQLYPTLLSTNTLQQIAAYLKVEPLTTAMEFYKDENLQNISFNQPQRSLSPFLYAEGIDLGDVRERLRVCLSKIKAKRNGCIDHSCPFYVIENYRALLSDSPIINEDDLVCIEKNIDDKCGKTIRFLYQKALVYQLFLESIGKIDKQDLPEEISNYLREDFYHILRLADENDQEFFTFSNFQFLSYVKKLCFKCYPVGMQNIEIGGFPRSLIFKQSFLDTINFARLVICMGGNYPLYVFHHNPHRFEMFSPEGLDHSLRLTSQLLARRNDIKGVFGNSWFNDPSLKEISHELSYLYEMPKEMGGKFFYVGSSKKDMENGFAFSKLRKSAYEEGRYQPTSYLMIMPRNTLIKRYPI